ncbi:MAG: hypothetical protein ACRDT6_19355 [Micromonosporaceae bacterium]
MDGQDDKRGGQVPGATPDPSADEVQVPVIELPVHDVRLRGPAPVSEVPPPGLSEAVLARRELALQLAAELTDPPVPHTPGHDLVSAVSIEMPVSYLSSVTEALSDAPEVPFKSPEDVMYTECPGGGVVRLHGNRFSVVFRFTPGQGPVLVLTDELPGYAARVDLDDTPDSRNRVALMIFGVLMGLGRPVPYLQDV